MTHEDYSTLEKRVNDLSSSVETTRLDSSKKLDLLLDLAKQMAVIHEKQIYAAESVKRLEEKIKDVENEALALNVETNQRIRKSDEDRAKANDRLHDRLDEIKLQVDDKNAKVTDDIKVTTIKLTAEKVSLAEAFDVFKAEYYSRVNFARGAIAAVSLIVAATQGLVYKYVDSIERSVTSDKVTLQKLESRFNETEKQIDIIQNRNLSRDQLR